MVESVSALQYLLIVFAGWVNRQQLDVIDYLEEENRVLREMLGEQCLHFTDAQRRRLAEKAKRLGRKVLNDVASIVTPDTLMAWHRKLIAMKWDHSHKRGPGRPRIMSDIAVLIVRMAAENSTWGYTRIQGALANLGHHVGRGTIANILKAHGIDPAPRRSKTTPWKTFIKAHWEVLAATDFFTVEVWHRRDQDRSFVPQSHPFVERVIGTLRREYLDHLFFWNGADLEQKLLNYLDYYNQHRCHTGLNGETPNTHGMEKASHCATL